ncbi:ABC-type transport auxiliary lipoprotein family protein [Roseinatronobacter alkalisoli]|uniref:ABC-type transport auxiliary lipoprotein family protein n=1 Tax=Roseinatronobacter alkalisoli TaxID=3028235 RepID=A0ABT5TBP1_9RHOB|nr:ABC-type transport auxiliary lipoprotein family protein [Roseinatronobacter sp. HJB301]MDD7972537.1 ABC-type transport auxiliary lipoprotein family protein [Roseinatronobacter sp. HJB301]
MTLTRRHLLTSSFALTALTGCGAVSALNQATTALDAYELRAPRGLPQAPRMLARSLSIEPPTTSGALDTDRILIKPNAVQSLYLPRVRWSENAPLMVQTLLLRAFEDTGALSYVGRRPLGGSGDFALLCEITDFQAELGTDGNTVATRMRVTARMVRESDARILGRRSFVATAPAASTDTLDIVESFNVVSDELITDLVRWGLDTVGLRLPVG